MNFGDDLEIVINAKLITEIIYNKGTAKKSSIYNNNRNLEIGKKSLINVVGRIEEQSSIALKLINLSKTNRLLNIKASGGTGKTTIIKKVVYELYNRGYYKKGVSFKSCENVKTYEDFEEILIQGFNLTNIIDFKNYLIDNYSSDKIDLLIILDNFETIVNALNNEEIEKVVKLLKFSSDYANIVITSRERLLPYDDFEDVYSLTPLITDDALELFFKHYGAVKDENEIKILRQEILEELLNNNPLAIKLVTKSRTRLKHIVELRDQIKEHFFESINEDYTIVFKNNADLNIERTKSIYQSINYSYTTLNNKEKLAFELLSLFPDGISLSNFKKCFDKINSSNNLSDKELRILKDKSLVEDYNGTLQLQPIIRRFADYQFSKRSKEIKQKYCLDAYIFNCHILELIELIERKKSISEALHLYNNFKNNFLKVFDYIPDIQISKDGVVPEKKYLINFIYDVEYYIVNEKQIKEFFNYLNNLMGYFQDLPNAETLMKVLSYNKMYFFKEFENSYKELSLLLSVDEMENRVYKDEDTIERRFKNIITNIHSMEGYTIQRINSAIKNDYFGAYLDSSFFYLGISNTISRSKNGFYHFEYELMYDRLEINKLEKYIKSLYSEEHLEIMQSTYTLSKVKKLNNSTIQKIVVTNPYTKGLKALMYAFNSNNDEDKKSYFIEALENLSHIKYYYTEALYFYCLFLNNTDNKEYKLRLSEGLELCSKYYYQYLLHLFQNIENPIQMAYEFSYDFYPIIGLDNYVKKHNSIWTKYFNENTIEY